MRIEVEGLTLFVFCLLIGLTIWAWNEALRSSWQTQECRVDLAEQRGRVKTFDRMLLATRYTAVHDALKMYGEHVGGDTRGRTVDDFAAWMKGQE